MKTAEELFDVITSNGCREMTLERFKQALIEDHKQIKKIINDMIEEDTINGYTTEVAIKLQELKEKI